MRSQNSFLIISLLIASYSYGQVPATVQASDKFVLENGTAYTHTEVVNTDWGGSHGIFFGSKFNYTGSGSLWDNGNMIYSNNAGSYNFGAFSLGYILPMEAHLDFMMEGFLPELTSPSVGRV